MNFIDETGYLLIDNIRINIRITLLDYNYACLLLYTLDWRKQFFFAPQSLFILYSLSRDTLLFFKHAKNRSRSLSELFSHDRNPRTSALHRCSMRTAVSRWRPIRVGRCIRRVGGEDVTHGNSRVCTNVHGTYICVRIYVHAAFGYHAPPRFALCIPADSRLAGHRG